VSDELRPAIRDALGLDPLVSFDDYEFVDRARFLSSEVERLTKENGEWQERVETLQRQLTTVRQGLINELGKNALTPTGIERLESAERQLAEAREALHKDESGLFAALRSIIDEIGKRRWITEGRGDYAHDDDRYRQETGAALGALKHIAETAIRESRKRAALAGGEKVERAADEPMASDMGEEGDK